MATTKVSQLTELTSADSNDLFLVADVSAGQSKKITKANLGISDENFTTALKTKLDGIETGATADQTGAEIKTAYEGEADTNAFTDAEKTKLSGIETGADVTDTTNVVAALTAGTNITIAGDGTISATDTDTGILNVVEDTTPQLGGDLDTNGNNINFGDNDVARFGAGGDLQIYHDGGNSVIADIVTGNLFIAGDNTVAITNAALNETKAEFNSNGAVNLYYDNSKKIATTSTGVDVTGTITADGIDLDDSQYIKIGTGDDLQIYHDGSNSYIHDSGTGNLRIKATNFVVADADNNDFIVCTDTGTGGSVELKHNASKKIETKSYGVHVAGSSTGRQTTDNDGSFDLSNANHFVCTPTANFTLTFTNHIAGQSGTIILINSGGYTVSAAATTKVMGADLLTTISTAGTYVLGYISDGTNTRIYNSGAQQ